MTRNADGRRRTFPEHAAVTPGTPPAAGIAPLLRRLLIDYAATGLPPAYLPKHEGGAESSIEEPEPARPEEIAQTRNCSPSVLNELRLLSAAQLDSRSLLTVVLGGDLRLTEKFRAPELVPLGSRIRVRLTLAPAAPHELADSLRYALVQAGNPHLMTPELIATLAEHAAGNLRILASMASELLDAATQRDLKQLNEKLCLETFAVPLTQDHARAKQAGRR